MPDAAVEQDPDAAAAQAAAEREADEAATDRLLLLRDDFLAAQTEVQRYEEQLSGASESLSTSDIKTMRTRIPVVYGTTDRLQSQVDAVHVGPSSRTRRECGRSCTTG